jgi:ABC-type transport system involved in cytochrome c biogenesis permease subunit
MSDSDASNDNKQILPSSRFMDFISGAKLTVALFALAVALLFFGTLDEARYGLDIASRAYFGSLIAIWQYPVEWPLGSVLCRLWLPLPGAPVVALAFLVNLGLAGQRNVRAGSMKSFRKLAIGTVHVGVLVVVVGYMSLLSGSPYAKNAVIVGASITVLGLALYYLQVLANYARANAAAEPPARPLRGRHMSRHWMYPALLGVAAGLFLCFSNNRAGLIGIFTEKKVELLPVLLYFASLCALCFAWIRKQPAGFVMNSVAAPLLSAGVVAHTIVVVMMTYLRRLPPAVDLYSTFVFAGWCGAMIAYYVERRRKDGISGAAAVCVACLTLGAAYFTGNGFSTGLNPMTASGMWLSLHVGTIVFGYGAVLLSVVLANLALFGRRFRMSPELSRTLNGLLYGSLATGVVFVAVGILMGGLWADRAWGRFWGWDPKENAALMLLIWCALILHARRCGWVRAVGFARLAALSGIVLGWSWVGTNLMGGGLHTYGLAASGTWLLVGYMVKQLLIVIFIRPRAEDNADI